MGKNNTSKVREVVALIPKSGKKTVKRSYRFTEEEANIIDEAVRVSGVNENRLVARSCAGYAMEYAYCESAASQFLYNTYMQRIAANRMHRTGQAFNPHPKGAGV